MSIKINKEMFFTESRIDRAIINDLSGKSVSFAKLKDLRFRLFPSTDEYEPRLIVSQVCQNPEGFKLKYKRVGCEFAKDLKKFPGIALSDGWEERLTEQVEERILLNPERTQFSFRVIGEPDPSLLIARVEQTALPLFRFQTAVYSYNEALHCFEGPPLDKEGFIRAIRRYPLLFAPKQTFPLEEKTWKLEPSSAIRCGRRDALYQLSKELQQGLLNQIREERTTVSSSKPSNPV